MNLESIIYLLKLLQDKLVETEKLSKTTLNIIKDIIESSTALREKIKDYLYSFKIDLKLFEDIQLIISSIPTTKTLSLVQKVQLLITSTENARELHTFEFFKQWFSLFLIGYTKVNETNDGEYSQLLQYWSERCSSLPDGFLKTLMRMDELIKTFQNEHYLLIFVRYMISLCFQKGK